MSADFGDTYRHCHADRTDAVMSSAIGLASDRAPGASATDLRPLPDVERALGWIVAGFNLLYILTASTGYSRFVLSTPVAGAAAITTLVVLPVVVASALAVFRRVSRSIWVMSVAGYLAASVLWPLCVSRPLDASDPSWVVAMLIPAVLQAVMATRSIPATGIVLVGLAAVLFVGATAAGHLPPTTALTHILMIAPFGMLLAVIVSLVRTVAKRTRAAQEASLREVVAARFDDVTETERIRTDALVHDTILTTLLQAASVESAEEAERAHRMAENAIRVIAHVSRSSGLGAGVRLRAAVSAHEQHLDPAIRSFEIILDDLGLEDLLLPADAADALLVAMTEAMDNSVRHAAADHRVVHLRPLGPDGVRIEVEDDGRGFDYPTVAGAGIRDRIITPVVTVEGRAELRSIIGSGTSVRLSWGSVSLSDVRTIDARLEELGA
jgi:two-component sensor histidine kinase